MGLKNREGVDIRDYWKDGIRAYMGTTFAGFPNTFMSYTPYAPTALVNGTTIIEAQCDFACAAIQKIRDSEQPGQNEDPDAPPKPIKSIEALSTAEDEWAAYVEAQNAQTLFPLTASWWTGANIPGKKAQMLTYLLGLGEYTKETRERLDRLEGFDIRYWDGQQKEGRASTTEASGLKRKREGVPLAEHVESTEQSVNGASEAAEILRPTVAAG